MAENDTTRELPGTPGEGREVTQRPAGRADDALKAAGRRRARRSRVRSHFESRHHRAELTDKP